MAQGARLIVPRLTVKHSAVTLRGHRIGSTIRPAAKPWRVTSQVKCVHFAGRLLLWRPFSPTRKHRLHSRRSGPIAWQICEWFCFLGCCGPVVLRRRPLRKQGVIELGHVVKQHALCLQGYPAATRRSPLHQSARWLCGQSCHHLVPGARPWRHSGLPSTYSRHPSRQGSPTTGLCALQLTLASAQCSTHRLGRHQSVARQAVTAALVAVCRRGRCRLGRAFVGQATHCRALLPGVHVLGSLE